MIYFSFGEEVEKRTEKALLLLTPVTQGRTSHHKTKMTKFRHILEREKGTVH